VLFAVITPKHPSVSEIANDGNVDFVGLDADTIKR